jgi:hypothetical protein
MAVERHPVTALLEAMVEAMQADDAPTAAFSKRVYVLDDKNVLPEEAQTPFWGIAVAGGRANIEDAGAQRWTWSIEVGAYQVLEAPVLGGKLQGLAPFAPSARAGLLDLAWAVNQTLRGFGLGEAGKALKWGSVDGFEETAGETIVGLDDKGNPASALVRRTVKFNWSVTSEFTPRQ